MKAWETRNGCRISRVLAGRSNVFLVSHDGKNILVDTSPSSRWKKLVNRLRQLEVEHLDALVLTHSHYDHVGNAARLKDKFKAKVIVHRQEADCLAKSKSVVPEGTNALTRFLAPRLARIANPWIKFAPCQPDVEVDSSFDLGEFGFDAYIMSTPGHSPGSISLIVDNEIAIVGDAMFGVVPGSVFPPYAVNAGQLVASWGKLLQTNCRLFLPAHGTANSRRLVLKEYDKRRGHDHEKEHE
jgi:glyoxylase-like metal-dependent hydrolase (beta-lactamase superfamily II)